MEPKLTEPFLGFTNTAEIWNSRACMIGIICTFVVELVNFWLIIFFFFFTIFQLNYDLKLAFLLFSDITQGYTADDWCGSGQRS